MMPLKIIPFKNKHQPQVDVLLQNINAEFTESMFSEASVPMKHVAHVIGNQFWVAMNGEYLIGTIGVLLKKNKCAVVKSMFVAKEHRGSDVAFQLLSKLISYCKRKNVRCIYLGTMSQMKAAHRFYEKNGFVKITAADVPADFGMNLVDDVFYQLVF